MTQRQPAKTVPVAHTLKQLKRGRWHDVAFQEIDYTGGIWKWHLGAEDQQLLWKAQEAGLLYVAQRKVGDYKYRLSAMTSLEWERGARP